MVLRVAKKQARLRIAARKNIQYVPPNFIYSPTFSSASIVIDAGCSYQADFSVLMMERFGVRAFGIDPTRKHRPALQRLERQFGDRFVHLPIAIAATDGPITFHESRTNESGSIFTDHINVQSDETIAYEVESVSLRTLMERIHANTVDMLKLDLEGAEYDLLGSVTAADVAPFRQIFVEFHHHAVSHLSIADTMNAVSRICSFGFESFSLDDHNFLFRRL
jgi:FkbM family methyltransferase